MAFTKTVIRCAVDVSAPKGTFFEDVKTGQQPEAWNTTDVEFQFAFFSGSGNDNELVDVSVFESITAQIMPKNKQGAEYCKRTVDVTAINAALTREQWLAGTDQHVKISFTNLEFNLPLAGADPAEFWLVVHGVTNIIPKAKDTFGGTILRVFEDGVPAPDGPLQGGNMIPALAVYNGAGNYVLAVTTNRVYKWTDGGANDTDLVNGTQTVNVTDTNFTAQGATVTLRGTVGQPVTAVVRGAVYLTSEESDARYVLKSGDIRVTCTDDGNTYRLNLRIVDGFATDSWELVGGGASTATLVCPDDGLTYAIVLRLVDGQIVPSYLPVA